MVKRKGERVSP